MAKDGCLNMMVPLLFRDENRDHFLPEISIDRKIKRHSRQDIATGIDVPNSESKFIVFLTDAK